MTAPFPTVKVLGVPFVKTTNSDFVNQLTTDIQTHQNRFVVTANPEIVMYARQHPEYAQALNTADYITPDGIGIIKGAALLKTPLPERITGYDTMLSLLAWCNQHAKRLFLLGAKATVLESVVTKIHRDYPQLIIAGTQDGYYQDADLVAQAIKQAQPDLVLVATGFPKQELFIEKYRHVSAAVWMGVGGSFDVLAGAVKRAPKFWQNHHLEWFYRLLQEPTRFKRMLVLPYYLWTVRKSR